MLLPSQPRGKSGVSEKQRAVYIAFSIVVAKTPMEKLFNSDRVCDITTFFHQALARRTYRSLAAHIFI